MLIRAISSFPDLKSEFKPCQFILTKSKTNLAYADYILFEIKYYIFFVFKFIIFSQILKEVYYLHQLLNFNRLLLFPLIFPNNHEINKLFKFHLDNNFKIMI